MRKIILIAAIFLLFAGMASAGEEYLADTDFEPSDFRGVRWQERLDAISDMEELYREEDGSEIICSRKEEDLRFGDAELESIEYRFVDGKLSTVSVVAKGEKNQKALFDEARSMFGRETLNMGEDYMWRFTDVMVMYSVEPDEQSVLFYKYIGFMNR